MPTAADLRAARLTRVGDAVRARLLGEVEAAPDVTALSDVRAALAGYGMSDWMIGALVDLFEYYRRSGIDGDASLVTDPLLPAWYMPMLSGTSLFHPSSP